MGESSACMLDVSGHSFPFEEMWGWCLGRGGLQVDWTTITYAVGFALVGLQFLWGVATLVGESPLVMGSVMHSIRKTRV